MIPIDNDGEDSSEDGERISPKPKTHPKTEDGKTTWMNPSPHSLPLIYTCTHRVYNSSCPFGSGETGKHNAGDVPVN